MRCAGGRRLDKRGGGRREASRRQITSRHNLRVGEHDVVGGLVIGDRGRAIVDAGNGSAGNGAHPRGS